VCHTDSNYTEPLTFQANVVVHWISKDENERDNGVNVSSAAADDDETDNSSDVTSELS